MPTPAERLRTLLPIVEDAKAHAHILADRAPVNACCSEDCLYNALSHLADRLPGIIADLEAATHTRVCCQCHSAYGADGQRLPTTHGPCSPCYDRAAADLGATKEGHAALQTIPERVGLLRGRTYTFPTTSDSPANPAGN